MAEPTRPAKKTPARKPGTNGTSGSSTKSGTGASATKSGQGVTKRKGLVSKIFAGFVITVLVAMIAGFAVIGIAYSQTTIPDPNSDFQTNTTNLYYRDGKTQLGTLAVQNRQSIPYSEMPQDIKDAVVAAENRTFWTDRGISLTGMVRAAWTILRGGEMQGGSTITQQYIKIYYLTSERSIDRKFKELLLAVKLSREVPKETILENYLNTIYFGRGAYGVQAASKAYFNTDAKDLTVPQAAVLASVLNQPGAFDPAQGKESKQRLTERYHYVLQGMAESGSITEAERAKYAQSLPKFPKIPVSNRYGGSNGFLVKMIENELAQVTDLSPAEISGGGLEVTTTFNQDMQKAAVSAAKSNTKTAAGAVGKKSKNLHAAIASVDVGSGEVLALYGGPDYISNSRNWATTARPTGSTFKTFALAAGLSEDFSLRSIFQGNTFTPPGTTTSIRNEFSMQYGPVTLLKATADSINTAFVDMTTQMTDGPKKIADAAQAAGAPKGPGWDTSTDRISLGIPEVSPLDMAGAYATFANNGTQVGNHVIKEVRDRNGKVIYKADTKGKRVFSEDVSRDVTYALSDVVEQGTGRTVSTLGRPVAGKTGTAGVGNDVVSAWFVAYTKQISTAVMYVAGDGGNGDLDPYARPGDSTFFGGTYPAQTWRDYMAVATQGQEVQQFDPPAWVNVGKVRTRTQQTYQPPTTRQPQTQSQQPSSSATSGKPSASQSSTGSNPTTSSRPSSQPTTSGGGGGGSTRPTTGTSTKSNAPTSQASNAPRANASAGGDG